MFKKLNAKGFSHHLLLFIIPIIAVAAIGVYVISASRASGGFVCTIGPVFTDGAGSTDGGVMNDGQQWYSVVLQNRTGTATSTLNDIAFAGKSSSGSTFTWNAQSYDGKYIDWLKGFSGVKILNNGTVQGQVRKPSTPAGVGQANWSVIVKGVTYTCNTTTNINTTYTQLVKEATTTASATPVTTTPAPVATTPTPVTTSPTPVNPVTPVVSLPTYTCTNLKLLSTGSYGNRFQVTIKNTSAITMNLNQFKFRAPSPSVSVDTPSGGTLGQNAQLNATFDSTAPLSAAWYGAYVVDAANTVRVTCSQTSVQVTTSPGTTTTDPIVNPVTDPNSGDTGVPTPTAGSDPASGDIPVSVSAPTVRPPANAKIADLGYVPSLHCVKIVKSTYATSSCADANGIMLIVTGSEKTPSKNLLTYDIDVLATHDTFGSVHGCAARTLNVSGKAKKFDCTVIYTDKTFFAGLKQSVLNKFKSIVAGAKADTFLNKSEAAAAVAKLKNSDALTKGVAIAMAYKGYATERAQGKLVFDYNESAYISIIKNIQESDCKASGGTFVSTTVGCNLPPAPTGGCKKPLVALGKSCVSQSVLDKAQAAADAANATATHLSSPVATAAPKQPKSVNCSGKGSLTHVGSKFTGLFWTTFTISPPSSAVLSNYPAFSDLTCFAYNWVSGSREYSLPTAVF